MKIDVTAMSFMSFGPCRPGPCRVVWGGRRLRYDHRNIGKEDYLGLFLRIQKVSISSMMVMQHSMNIYGRILLPQKKLPGRSCLLGVSRSEV